MRLPPSLPPLAASMPASAFHYIVRVSRRGHSRKERDGLSVCPSSLRPSDRLSSRSAVRRSQINMACSWPSLLRALSLSLPAGGEAERRLASLLQLARPQFYLLQCCRAVVNVTRNLAADVGSREEKIWSSRQAGINLCYSQSVRK